MTRSERRARNKHHEVSQSEAVLGLHRDANELIGAIRALKGTAAAALVQRLETVLADGEELPDVEFLFELLGRLVKRDRDAVEDADSDRWVRAMELYTLRMDCKEAKDELYRQATWVRSHLVELYGSKHCRFRFGLSERTPRGAADLADEVGRLVRRLSRPDLKLPPPPAGLQGDPGGWVAILKPRLERLEKLLGLIEACQRGAAEDKQQERRIQAECRETHKLVGRSLEALFTLAGEEMLARSLRSAARQRARRPHRQRSSAPRKVLKPALASIVEWLRSLLGRPKPKSGRISGIPRFSAGTGVRNGPQPPSQRWQRGSERPRTPAPALAAGF